METGPIYMAEIMKNLNIIFHFDDSNNDKPNNDKETGEHISTLADPSFLHCLIHFFVFKSHMLTQISLHILKWLLNSSHQNSFPPPTFL